MLGEYLSHCLSFVALFVKCWYVTMLQMALFIVVCKQAAISVFHMCFWEIESSVSCQVFNYHFIQSRQCPPPLCFSNIVVHHCYEKCIIHYSSILVDECWSKTPFPVSDSLIQTWHLWWSCLNALWLKVCVEYKAQRDKTPPPLYYVFGRQINHMLVTFSREHSPVTF